MEEECCGLMREKSQPFSWVSWYEEGEVVKGFESKDNLRWRKRGTLKVRERVTVVKVAG